MKIYFQEDGYDGSRRCLESWEMTVFATSGQDVVGHTFRPVPTTGEYVILEGTRYLVTGVEHNKHSIDVLVVAFDPIPQA